MNLPGSHPALLGSAMLHVLKQGKTVEHITVWFTHGQLHRYFSEQISKHYPLEMTLAEGMDMEQKIDCRLFTVPWQIDIRTKAQKKAARVPFVAPAPTPPAEKTDPKILAAVDALFEPYHRRIATEYRLLEIALRREKIRQVIRQRRNRPPPGDTAHVQ